MPSVSYSERLRGEEPKPSDFEAELSDDVEASNHSDEGSQGSDSLDSSEPRKRRKVSPDLEGESDDLQDLRTAAASSVRAPSRIRRKLPQQARSAATTAKEEDAPEPARGILVPTDSNTTFDSLGVNQWLVQSLANMAIRRPTGIQKGCIPEIMKGRDCIGGSRTGSGKTVAFAVPILQKWAEDPSAIFAVVLTPTR
jgi:ATP-dependent RNA helicase DDX49/DBP8